MWFLVLPHTKQLGILIPIKNYNKTAGRLYSLNFYYLSFNLNTNPKVFKHSSKSQKKVETVKYLNHYQLSLSYLNY